MARAIPTPEYRHPPRHGEGSGDTQGGTAATGGGGGGSAGAGGGGGGGAGPALAGPPI